MHARAHLKTHQEFVTDERDQPVIFAAGAVTGALPPPFALRHARVAGVQCQIERSGDATVNMFQKMFGGLQRGRECPLQSY